MSTYRGWTLFYCIIYAVGGFLVAVLVLVLPARNRISDDTVRMCESSIITAELIRGDEIAELRRRTEQALVAQAEVLAVSLRKHPGAEYFLWRIREYFNHSSEGVPDALRVYFESLPDENPRPEYLYHTGP